MTWVRSAILALVLAGILIFGAPSARAASYAVTITTTQFIPSTLQTAVGDQVTFLNSTTATQSARTTDPTGFNSGDIGAGQSKTVTLSTAGTFTYSSAYNSALSGTITITGTSTSIATSSGTTSTTSTVATTQPQPVTGVFEDMLILIGGGFAFLGFGWYGRRRSSFVKEGISVVDLPLISSSAEASRDDHTS